jgi:proline iminopeptidase
MRVEVNGVRLFFDVEGAKLVPDGRIMREKPTLILLHGGPGIDHSSFKPAFAAFADICQVIYFDHRGHGRSAESDEAHWNLDQWADDLVGLCDALEIERPVVMGISFGGCVAMRYATRHSAHPSKLILGSTHAGPADFERSLRVFERLGGIEARTVAQRAFGDPAEANYLEFLRVCLPLYTRTPADPDVAHRFVRRRGVGEFFRRGELHTMDLLPDLSRVQCPTLVFGGDDDPMTPIQDQEDIAAALPASLVQFHRIPNAGHVPYRDEPRVFDIIRQFILS